jgi:hypothetical protein
MHKFFGITPEVFVAEVSRQFVDADVEARFPSYSRWFSEPGIHGSEVDTFVEELQNSSQSAEHIVMIGLSAGAYLATLLGNLLPASHVLGYAPVTDFGSINLGYRGRLNNLDPRYIDLLPYCKGEVKMLLVTDESQLGPKNAHNPEQVNRLSGAKNLTIERREKLAFQNHYFPSGKFASDLYRLVS